MFEQQLQVQKEFFEDSAYAKKIIEQSRNDAEGLIFDEFVHKIGAFLEIDVIYDSLNEDETKWLLGEDSHVKVNLVELNDTFLFTFFALTDHGKNLINRLFEEFLTRHTSVFSTL